MLLLKVIEIRILDRSSCFHVDVGGPGDGCKGMRPQQFAISAIDDVKESVFGGLQQDFSVHSVHRHVGERNVLDCRVIPVIAWRGLVVPVHATGVGV